MMKNKFNTLKCTAIVVLITAIIFGACDNYTTGGKGGGGANGGGTITITVGSGNSRAVIDIEKLTHKITVTDNSGAVQSRTINPPGGTANISSLALGTCTILVEGFLNGSKVSEGKTSKNIVAGSNGTVSIQMKLIDKGNPSGGDGGSGYTVTFNSNGGSRVASQTVKKGETATKPHNPAKDYVPSIGAGLYRGTPEEILFYTFEGWYNGTTPYTFTEEVTADITLTAQWAEPVLNRVSSVPANDVDAAFSHVNGGGTYTLLIESAAPSPINLDNGNNGFWEFNSNIDLTIIGIGNSASAITGTSIITAKYIRLYGGALTLGNKATLDGIGVITNNSGATFIMKPGSKVTNHDANYNGSGTVWAQNGKFIMDGGEISNNFGKGSYGYYGVRIEGGCTFEYYGGTIRNNYKLDEVSNLWVYWNATFVGTPDPSWGHRSVWDGGY